VSPRHRRDFLLDSGAVTALATNKELIADYVQLLDEDYNGSILIPLPVVIEFSSGDPRKDVLVDRFINAVIKTQGTVYLPLTSLALAKRAGALRAEAQARTTNKISPIDALIVAIAEELSHRSAITIITGDTHDIQLLVNLVRRSNISVDVVG
jgi:hypothetical protein